MLGLMPWALGLGLGLESIQGLPLGWGHVTRRHQRIFNIFGAETDRTEHNIVLCVKQSWFLGHVS